MDNYRPISVLPTVSKIIEKITHAQFSKYLTNHHLLTPYQCRFRKFHSTETAVLSLTDTIRKNVDLGMLTVAVFIDLRKAFDSVNHTLLLDKIRSCGVTDTELLWFRSYLTNRKQAVSYQNVLSDLDQLSTGVPQGSILGSLLFILFINDLPRSVKSSSILMYADDAVVFHAAKDVSSINATLSLELDSINNWMRQNGLIMHKAKTECILFGYSNKLSKTDHFSVCVEGHVQKTVTEFKYLGVVLDGGLSYSAHIKYLLSKVGKRIGMLGRVRNQLTANSADTVFKSFILPQLDYCDTVWSSCGSTNKRLLDKLQRRASKLVLNTTDSD